MSLNSIHSSDSKSSFWDRLTKSSSKAKPTKLSDKKSIFTTTQIILAYTFVSIWLIIFVEFSMWYFFNSYSNNTVFFVITTITIFWLPLLAIYFFYFSLRQQDYAQDFNKVADGRLALITTKIPSEPFYIISKTLKAMLNQDFPREYDVWLCDEDPSEETIAWCANHGVKISTRRDNPEYHRTEHPRKRRCKEGNLAFFYDHYGYKDYDFVIQFDADHAPEPEFAKEVMKHFTDSEVGYVASPSIIDANTHESWTVTARNFWESTTHGPLQSGSQDGFAPMCFGSHYSLRISALKEIGGIGPEIAEDFTTTLMMNSHGWKGSFARNAIAHGMGAVGVVDSMKQEFQWAMVGMRAALLVAPKVFWQMPAKIRFQMLIWTTWYPLVSLISLASIILPPIYMWLRINPIYVDGNSFWIKYLTLNFSFIIYVLWLKYLKQLRPTWSWQISWETMVFQLLQLPWIFLGWIVGIYQVITGYSPIKADKRKMHITDKSNSSAKPINFKYFLPHFIIIAVNIPGIILLDPSVPYYWFSFVTAATYSISVFIGVVLSIKEVKNFDKYKGSTIDYINRYFATISVSTLLLCLTIISLL